MLSKLLKYDLKWCFKPLSVFYILAIFFSLITRIVENMSQNLIVLVIDKICSAIVISMFFSILINCFMRNWVRFIRNIYKDESYLTHTLPVSKNSIYLSKVLTIIITLLVSFIVIIICAGIVLLNKESWLTLKNVLESTAIFFDSSVIGFITVLFLTLFSQFLVIMLSGVLGIILGHKSNNLKIVKSIIYGFIIYIVLSFLTLGIVYVCSLIYTDLSLLFESITINSSVLKSTMLIVIFIYTIYNLAIYYVSNKLLNKGVNVD